MQRRHQLTSFFSHRGFTLLELIVTLSIIAILTTALVASFGESRAQARDAQRASDVRNLQTAIELYRQKNGVYPTSCDEAAYSGSGYTGCSDVRPDYVQGIQEFILPLPKERMDGNYIYYVNDERTVYKIMAAGSIEVPVSVGHPLQRCDTNVCSATASCDPDSDDFRTSYAAWGGFAEGGVDDVNVLSNTGVVACI